MNVIRTPRSRRLLAAAAVLAALVAIPAGASARKFEANLRQYGTGTTFDLGCQDGKKPTCSFTIGGELHGTLVEGTFFGLAIANMAQPVSNNAGGWCYPVEVPMALNTPVPDGDAVFQKIKGMLCDYGAPGGARGSAASSSSTAAAACGRTRPARAAAPPSSASRPTARSRSKRAVAPPSRATGLGPRPRTCVRRVPRLRAEAASPASDLAERRSPPGLMLRALPPPAFRRTRMRPAARNVRRPP